METRKQLIALAIYYRGNWNKILQALSAKKLLPDATVEYCFSLLKSKVITILDSDYPEYLKELTTPPFVLFYYGDISLINDPSKCISVVGSREPSMRGKEMTQRLVKGLPKDTIVVSGLAKGIDSIAHKAAIASGHKTIGVIGCGIDNIYPYENKSLYARIRKNGNLLVSEYPDMYPPNQFNFPVRNRLIAMFSSNLLVTEAKVKSGSMITVFYAQNFGRNIMAVPSADYGNSGCNVLIREGAMLVESEQDVNDYCTPKTLL